ncbi:MAG: carbon monoxide dehydrogenase subunit G [Oricola sp.]
MEMNDEIRIEAPRARVYDALNDPTILKECIPGCEELIRHSDSELEAKVVLKVGPVKAKFGGNVTLDNAQAPHRFSLTGEGSGGVAGFAKGGADVELVEDGDATILRYTAKVDIGGKIAQLGSRLIVSTSQRLAGAFFEKFRKVVEGDVAAPLVAETVVPMGQRPVMH